MNIFNKHILSITYMTDSLLGTREDCNEKKDRCKPYSQMMRSIMLKNIGTDALAGVAQWIERRPTK